jgi:hypothetical protein
MALTLKQKFSARAKELLQRDEDLFKMLESERKAVCDETLSNFQKRWNESRQRISELIDMLGRHIPIYLTLDQKLALLPTTQYSDAMALILCKLLEGIVYGSILLERLPTGTLWEIIRQLDWKSVKNLVSVFFKNPRMRLILRRFLLRQEPLPPLRPPGEVFETFDNQLLLISRTLFWTSIMTSFQDITLSFIGKTSDDEFDIPLFKFTMDYSKPGTHHLETRASTFFYLTTLARPNSVYEWETYPEKHINKYIESVYNDQYYAYKMWTLPIGDPASYSFVISLLQEIIHSMHNVVRFFSGGKKTETEINIRLSFDEEHIISNVAHHVVALAQSPIFPFIKNIDEFSEIPFETHPVFIDLPKLSSSNMDDIDRRIVEFFSRPSERRKYQRPSPIFQDIVEIQLFWFDHYRALKMLGTLENLDESEQRLRAMTTVSTFPQTRALFDLPNNMCLMPLNLPGNPLVDAPNISRVLYYFEKYGKRPTWYAAPNWSEHDYFIF